MQYFFNKKNKLIISSFLLFFIVIAFAFFINSNSINAACQPNNNTTRLAAGDYNFNIYAATGAAQSNEGGNVQINNGPIVASDSQVFSTATLVTVTAIPNVGYEFAGWYTAIIGGQLVSRSSPYTFSMPVQDTTFYAIFSISKYWANAISSPIGAGVILGDGNHNYNSLVTLTANPASDDYEFYRWIDQGTVVSTNNEYTFTIIEDKNFIAEFKVKNSVSVNGNGKAYINNDPYLTQDYFAQGELIQITAIPDIGYEFIGWTGDTISQNPNPNVLVGTSASNYIANFQIIGTDVILSATEGGALKGSSPSGNYGSGEIINLKATANEGYFFSHWEGEVGGSLEINSENTSYMITIQDVERGFLDLTAVFYRDPAELSLHAVTEGVLSGVGGKVAINQELASSSISLMLQPNSLVAIHAIKQNGYKFKGWYTQQTGGQLVSDQPTYEFDMTITASTFYARYEVSYWTEHKKMPAGDGTVDDPYLISTPNELSWLAFNTNAGYGWSSGVYAELVNSIDISSYLWEPIGNNNTKSVSSRWLGILDGKGHIIKGLNIYKQHSSVDYNGLFGYIYGEQASIKNLGIEDVNINAISDYNNYSGALAGQNERSTIEKCYIKNANINVQIEAIAYCYVGGIVGNNMSGYIANCFSDANIIVYNPSIDASYAGGIVGNNYNVKGRVDRTYTLGNIQIDNEGQESNYVGSIIGYNSFGASLIGSYSNADKSSHNLIGTNNANSQYNFALNTDELKNVDTYLEGQIAWDFIDTWLMSEGQLNDGYPVLQGIGNLIVTTIPTENGDILPAGQAMYYEGSALAKYIITPHEGYEIDELLINGEVQESYSGARGQTTFIFNKPIGVFQIEANFRVRPMEPLDIASFVLVSLVILLIVIFIIKRILGRALKRRRMIRGGIRSYRRRQKYIKTK